MSEPWMMECPKCGKRYRASGLYQHCRHAHGMNADDLRAAGMERAECPICGVMVNISCIGDHLRSRHPDPRPARPVSAVTGVTLDEASRMTGVSVKTLRKRIDENRLRAVKDPWNGRWTVAKEDLPAATSNTPPAAETVDPASIDVLENRLERMKGERAHLEQRIDMERETLGLLRELAATRREIIRRGGTPPAPRPRDRAGERAVPTDLETARTPLPRPVDAAAPRRPRRPLDPRRLTGQGRPWRRTTRG